MVELAVTNSAGKWFNFCPPHLALRKIHRPRFRITRTSIFRVTDRKTLLRNIYLHNFKISVIKVPWLVQVKDYADISLSRNLWAFLKVIIRFSVIHGIVSLFLFHYNCNSEIGITAVHGLGQACTDRIRELHVCWGLLGGGIPRTPCARDTRFIRRQTPFSATQWLYPFR